MRNLLIHFQSIFDRSDNSFKILKKTKYNQNLLMPKNSPKKFINNDSISYLSSDRVGVLWPNGRIHNNVHFLLTDASPYMCKYWTHFIQEWYIQLV